MIERSEKQGGRIENGGEIPLRLNPGCEIYTVKLGDTLYGISKQFNTSLEAVFTANPGINPIGLHTGQQVVVPYAADIVRTDITYDYKTMEHDILELKKRYPFLEIGSAGSSVIGRNLYYIRLGRGKRQIFINCTHHADEWITTVLAMKFIEDFLKAYATGVRMGSCEPAKVWSRSSVYIMPMVNPDGVELVINGISCNDPYYSRVIQYNRGSADFSGWGANINGVDLNHNYDADWEITKKREAKYHINGPSRRRYSGPGPESEPEAKAVVSFARSHDFKLTLSYHAGRGQILWTFNSHKPSGSEHIGEMLKAASGYFLAEPGSFMSNSGFKDWFIKEYERPSFVVEVSSSSLLEFEKVYCENMEVLTISLII